MNNIKPLWDGDTSNPKPPLRRPNSVIDNVCLPTNQNLQQTSLERSTSFNGTVSEDGDIASRSTLSANAKEWYPPNYKQNVPPEFSSAKKSVQERLTKFKIPSEATQACDITKLKNIIDILTQDPGEFDNLHLEFIETLSPYYDISDVISDTTDLIVNQALTQSNFRYSAARLCAIIKEQCSMFRKCLDLLFNKKVIDNPYEPDLVLFLAELYTQLNFDNLYGHLVIVSLKHVVQLGTDRSIKAVCQVLKLAGPILEVHYKDAIDNIFKQLNKGKSLRNATTINVINSVNELRNLNWGQGQSNAAITNYGYEEFNADTMHDGPIFYGPDGKQLTEEECEFLTDNCATNIDFLTDDSDPDGLWDPDPEMNEEMQAAFSEFVKLNK